MLQDRIIGTALTGAESVVAADRSRCVRMRFNRSSCSHCAAACRAEAVSVDGVIMIDGRKCTGCMLCVSECPSGCLSAVNEDFSVLLGKLRTAQHSVPDCVLGCKSARGIEAHVKTCCLGFLSEEHLVALAASLDKPLLLNLSACGTCRNHFIVEKLKMRLYNVRTKTNFDAGKMIALVEKKSDMVFEDISLDRRDFFRALKTAAFSQVAELVDGQKEKKPAAYSTKSAPAKRELLNRVLRQTTDVAAAESLLRNYAFTVKAGSSCTACSACAGMCPTGALKIQKAPEGAGLVFNASLCSGCGLCGEFCPTASVTILQGYSGTNYFEHAICHDSRIGHAVSCNR